MDADFLVVKKIVVGDLDILPRTLAEICCRPAPGMVPAGREPAARCLAQRILCGRDHGSGREFQVRITP
jgi:hypothetical protein